MGPSSRPHFERLASRSPEYARLPIAEAFDWEVCAAPEDEGEWYLVCFRSVRQPHADEAMLAAYDDLAHLEAEGSPGFRHYFKGATDAAGACLSFCIWDSRAEARSAAGGSAHARASSIVHEMYVSYTLEFYRVRRTAAEGRFTFEAYDRPPTAVA